MHLPETSSDKKTTTISESKCAMQESKKCVKHCSFCVKQPDAVNRSVETFEKIRVKLCFDPSRWVMKRSVSTVAVVLD